MGCRFGDQIPVGVVFSVHIYAGPGAHPSFCAVNTGFYSVGKAAEGGVDRSSPYSANVKERVGLYL
jgi:hypothetical protein